ncbi:hypothetical protein [Rhizobium sp. IBUN]|uniref:hypothetical protein n=1 Tax=Rhizobium sp. IBUN TaxID=1042326 RepID=UPI00040CF7F3|nr:hypothetical protein [Rhizobium sp. IBUN]
MAPSDLSAWLIDVFDTTDMEEVSRVIVELIGHNPFQDGTRMTPAAAWELMEDLKRTVEAEERNIDCYVIH